MKTAFIHGLVSPHDQNCTAFVIENNKFIYVGNDELDEGEVPVAKFVMIVAYGDADNALNEGCAFHDYSVIVKELPGDLNFDDSVDVDDAILLLQHSMFPSLYPIDEYIGSLDFNNDGNIDINDAILLLQHSLFPELYPIS